MKYSSSKVFLLLLVSATFSLAHAQEKGPYKNWKDFTSDYGFEFKYPDCWTLKGDSPDAPRIANSSTDSILVTETDICKRPLMYSSAPNGISMFVDPVSLSSKEQGLKEIESVKEHSDSHIARDRWKIYKTLKVEGDGNAQIYVQSNKNVTYKWIRWQMELYCPTRLIRFVGPAIKDPDEALLKKFKAGDLALPEPEKTIYESIKCVEPKIKK